MEENDGTTESLREVGQKTVRGKGGSRRNMVPANIDANSSVGRPAKLTDLNRAALDEILAKFTPDEIIPLIESLIVAGEPIRGFKKQIDEEYFLFNFLRIGHTASKPYDRIKAFEAAMRLQGYGVRDNRGPVTPVNITMEVTKPAEYTDIDKEFVG